MSALTGGIILFDNIIDIDWDNDDPSSIRGPHIYCDFENGKLFKPPRVYVHNDKDENMNFMAI